MSNSKSPLSLNPAITTSPAPTHRRSAEFIPRVLISARTRGLKSALRAVAFALAVNLGLAGASAADIQKADNNNALNLGTSWVGGVAPGPSDFAVWGSTVSADNTTNDLGANTTWQGISIQSPASPVQINADGNTLTNGNVNVVGNVGIDMSAATQNLTLSNNFVVNGVQNWNIDSQTLTFGGNLARNAGGVIRFYQSGGGTPTVIMTNGSAVITNSGTPNAMLGGTYGNIFFATLNDLDFVGLQSVPGGFQIEPGANTGIYTANGAGNTDPGNANVIDVVTGGAFGQRASSTRTWAGLRFNSPQGSTPESLGVFTFNGLNYWMINIPSGRTVTGNAILVTTNVGNSPVLICNGGASGGTTGFFRIGNGGAQDLLIYQNNPLQPLIFMNNVSISQQGTGSFVKMGAGAVQINRPSTYTGTTRIYEGTLELDGTGTVGSNTVSVFGGAFAASSGTTNSGSTTIFTGATSRININTNGGFALFTSNLTLQANTRFQVAFSNLVAPSATTAALIITNVNNGLTASNTITVDIIGGTVALGQYPLIKYSGTIGGNGGNAFVLGSLEPHASGYISNNVANSSIDLVVTNDTQPLVWSVGNGTWDIASTANWLDSASKPTTYQENAAAGDNVVFNDTAAGPSPITVTLNSAVTPSSVTFNNSSFTYTLSGAGSIFGNDTFTKSSPGTLFLQTTNFFTGGININGGVVNFLTLSNLGAGPINFGGGTLQYASGTLDDISVDTVNLNAGGGTIDVNGNAVVFAHPIGTSSSTGGLTVTGGELQINGTNRYAGNTVVNSGSTLRFQNNATFISNSAALVVNGTLDSSGTTNGITLSTGAGQKLVGTGTAMGTVSTASGTTISPATNGTYGTLTIAGDLIVDNGTLAMDIAGPTGASQDLLAITTGNGTGSLTLDNGLNSGTIALNITGTLNNGVYPLISYAGTLTGSPAADLSLSGFSQPGQLAYLSASAANNGTINLNVIPSANNSLLWNGLINNVWDNNTTGNWTSNGVTGQIFQNGDNVAFDDTSAQTTVALGDSGVSGSGVLLPGSITINATNNNYTLQDGVGDGSSLFLGTMSLTITSSVNNVTTILTPNANTGNTTLFGGTLQVGNGSVAADIGKGNIIDDGTLIFDQNDTRVVVGSISGTGPLIHEGATVLALLTNNSYAGTTTISNANGTLQIGTGGSIGTLGAGAVADNGTLFIDRSGSFSLSNGVTGPGSVVLAGGAAFTLSGTLGWWGNTYLTNGSIKLASANQIPNITTVAGSTGNFGLGGRLDLNGFNQAVNGLTDLGLTNGIITNSAAAGVTNILTIGLNAPSNSLTYSGLIVDVTNRSGIGLVINNPGNITLAGASTYRGGTTVGGGATLTLGTAGSAGLPGNSSAGVGTITMSNGTTLFLNGNVTTFVTNPVALPPASTLLLEFQNLGNGYSGPISGDSASTLAIPNIGQGISFNGANIQQLNGFFGTLLLTNLCTLRFSATTGLNNGGTNTTFDIEGSGQIEMRNTGTATMGALVGTGFINGPTTGGNGTWIIGGKNANDTFNGTFAGVNNLVKNGTATLTMAGSLSNGFYSPGLTYVGSTTVSNGTLQIVAPGNLNGTNFTTFSLASQSAVLDISSAGTTPDNATLVTNSTTLDLESGQSLTGIGMIYGGLIASNGSTVSVAFQPDTNHSTLTGTLAITTNAEFAGAIQLNLCNSNTPNAGEIASPTITIDPSATLVVTNVGPGLLNGDKFQLFNHPVSGFASVVLPSADPSGQINYTWTTNLAVDGSITLASGGVNLNPTNMTLSVGVSGTNLTITWPGDHVGWALQSNSVGLSASNQWFTIPGSTSVTNEILNIDHTRTNVFFRMQITP